MPSEDEVWNIQMIYQINQQACLKCVNLKSYRNFPKFSKKTISTKKGWFLFSCFYLKKRLKKFV